MIQQPIFMFIYLLVKAKLRRNEAGGLQFNPYILTEQSFLTAPAQKAVCTSELCPSLNNTYKKYQQHK